MMKFFSASWQRFYSNQFEHLLVFGGVRVSQHLADQPVLLQDHFHVCCRNSNSSLGGCSVVLCFCERTCVINNY